VKRAVKFPYTAVGIVYTSGQPAHARMQFINKLFFKVEIGGFPGSAATPDHRNILQKHCLIGADRHRLSLISYYL
jgi:hypothetical protein